MSNAAIHIKTFLPFRVRAVWQAWTDPAIIMLWFGSDPDGTVDKAFVDPRPGGQFEISFRNLDRTKFICRGMYEKVEAPKLLTFSWIWENEPGQVSNVRVHLAPHGVHATNMTFTHSDLWADSAHDYKAGWKRTFEKLERALAG